MSAKNCTTHHHACDCREEHFKKLIASFEMETAGHAKENVKLKEENKVLTQWVQGLYIFKGVQCVYCGHRYPPGTPDVRDIVLLEHISVCPKHPLSAAMSRIKELELDCVDYREAMSLAKPINALLGEQNRVLKALLAQVECPVCDGSGGVPVRHGSEWEQEQCQWCAEKERLLCGDNNGN